MLSFKGEPGFSGQNGIRGMAGDPGDQGLEGPKVMVVLPSEFVKQARNQVLTD